MIGLLLLTVIGMSLVGATFMAVLMAWKYRSWTFATGWALLAVGAPLSLWWFVVGTGPRAYGSFGLFYIWVILLLAMLAGSLVFIARRARKRPPHS